MSFFDLPMDVQRKLDAIADEFESDWSRQSPPNFDFYLQRIDEKFRWPLLELILVIDVELKQSQGQMVAASDYSNLGHSAVQCVDEFLQKHRHGKPTESHQERLTSRRQIGQYKLLQQIGKGGMGTVWMAKQEQPIKRHVAVKLIREDLVAGETNAQFAAERQALAMMDHPHIAKVFDAGTTDNGKPYFVMELVKGIPITQFCNENKLSIQERLKLFKPVCKAVQHAHQKGIIHRDLKPSNVLVTADDGEAIPKVIDFGLAKALKHTTRLTDETLITEFGKIVGTLQYMSPEQAGTNALDIDTRTDVYSLGVLLYELLIDSTPLNRADLRQNALLQVLELIRERETPKPSDRLSNSGNKIVRICEQRKITPDRLQQILQGDLDWVVMKALEKDRRRRYETAISLAEDIDCYLKSEPVKARPPSKSYRLRKFVNKNSGTVAAIASLVFVLVVSTVLVAMFAWQADLAREKAEFESKRTTAALAQKQAALDETKKVIDKYVETIQNEEILKEQRFKSLITTLLKDALTHYQRFVGRHEHDETKMSELATTFFKIGLISYSIGKDRDGMDAFQKSLDLRSRLVKNNPDATKHLVELATCNMNIGIGHHRTSAPDASHKSYLRALAIYEGLLAKQPKNVQEYQNLLATCLNNIGAMYIEFSEPNKALKPLQRSLRIRNSLVSVKPTNPQYQIQLAVSHQNLGRVYYEMGKLGDSLTSFRSAMRIAEKMAEVHANVAEYQAVAATSHSNIALLLAETNEPEEARKYFVSAIDAYEQLVANNPNNNDYREGLAGSHYGLGILFTDIDQPNNAMTSFERAINAYEPMTKENPERSDLAVDVGGIHVNVAILAIHEDEFVKAERRLRSALDLLGHVINRNPGHQTARLYLHNAYYTRAGLMEKLGRYREAVNDWGMAKKYLTGGGGEEIEQRRQLAAKRISEKE